MQNLIRGASEESLSYYYMDLLTLELEMVSTLCAYIVYTLSHHFMSPSC